MNVEDGHKWQLADLKILRRVSDRLCKKHGLSILPEKEVAKSKSPAQRDAERNGTSWKKETQMAVDAALENHLVDKDDIVVASITKVKESVTEADALEAARLSEENETLAEGSEELSEDSDSEDN